MTTVMVYGTLKRGGYNHHLLEKAEYIGEATVRGFRLYRMGGFPAASRSWVEPRVFGEVFRVTPEQLARLDQLEGVAAGWYRRQVVQTEAGDAVSMYTMTAAQVAGREAVKGGVWPVGRTSLQRAAEALEDEWPEKVTNTEEAGSWE